MSVLLQLQAPIMEAIPNGYNNKILDEFSEQNHTKDQSIDQSINQSWLLGSRHKGLIEKNPQALFMEIADCLYTIANP